MGDLKKYLGEAAKGAAYGVAYIPANTRAGNAFAAYAAALRKMTGMTPESFGELYDQYDKEYKAEESDAFENAPTAAQIGTAISSEGVARGMPLSFRGQKTIITRPKENAKYKESGDQIFGIGFKSGDPEHGQGGTCAGCGRRAGECLGGCYDLAEEKVYQFGDSRLNKQQIFEDPRFLDQWKEIVDSGREVPWLRPGSPGGEPFYSDKAAQTITEMAKYAPNTNFAAFTKRPDMIRSGKLDGYLSLPNAGLIQSKGGRFDWLIDPRLPTTEVFPKGTQIPPGYIDAGYTLMPLFNAAVRKEPARGFLEAHGSGAGKWKKNSPALIGGRRVSDPWNTFESMQGGEKQLPMADLEMLRRIYRKTLGTDY